MIGLKKKPQSIETVRIDRAVKVLDNRIPDWLEKINLDKLSISHAHFCVLGQVSKGKVFQAGYKEVTGKDWTWFSDSLQWAVEHGFLPEAKPGMTSKEVEESERRLTAAWVRRINSRRENVKKKEEKQEYAKTVDPRLVRRGKHTG